MYIGDLFLNTSIFVCVCEREQDQVSNCERERERKLQNNQAKCKQLLNLG
jgi:hypothetical protein